MATATSETWKLAQGVALLFVAGCWFATTMKSSNQESTGHGLEAAATVEVHGFVMNGLKSPSTADFPWDDVSKMQERSAFTYELSSYVDSQNGFGTMIRTYYTAIVRRTGNDWQLIQFRTSASE